MKMTDELCVTNRDDWREWLKRNHNTKNEIWLIYSKKNTSKPSIPYDDSVEEAICFGWIDNIIKRIDDEKFARKFTPRKGKSRWSDINKKRARKMMREGKMTDVGLARIKEAKKSGEWVKVASVRKELVILHTLKRR